MCCITNTFIGNRTRATGAHPPTLFRVSSSLELQLAELPAFYFDCTRLVIGFSMHIIAVYVTFVQLHALNVNGFGAVMVLYTPWYGPCIVKCFCVCEALMMLLCISKDLHIKRFL